MFIHLLLHTKALAKKRGQCDCSEVVLNVEGKHSNSQSKLQKGNLKRHKVTYNSEKREVKFEFIIPSRVWGFAGWK